MSCQWPVPPTDTRIYQRLVRPLPDSPKERKQIWILPFRLRSQSTWYPRETGSLVSIRPVRKQGSKILNKKKKVSQLASGRARAPWHLGLLCPCHEACPVFWREVSWMCDPRGHGRALQLAPSWGENGPRCCFMSGAESCLVWSTCLPWIGTSV